MREKRHPKTTLKERREWLRRVQALEHNLSTYNRWGCRCPKCKLARAEYDRVYNLEVRLPKTKGPGELI